jgi:hypothetical protein
MCQMCDEYEAELRRLGVVERIIDDQPRHRGEEGARKNGPFTEKEPKETRGTDRAIPVLEHHDR